MGWRLVCALAPALGMIPAAGAGAGIASPNQVMVHVKVLSVERTALRQLGVEWQGSPFQTADRGLGNLPGLEALLEGDGSRTLARPSAITNTGREATLEIGGEPDALRDVGIVLDLLPTVSGDRGFIELGVVLRVNELPVEAGQPAITPRRAETTTRLENGGSLLIGGLFDPPGPAPWFGKLPFVGQLFQNPDAQEPMELLLMVTPWLVDQDGGRSSGSRAPPQVYRHRPDPNVKAPKVPNQMPKQPAPSPSYPYGQSDRVNP